MDRSAVITISPTLGVEVAVEANHALEGARDVEPPSCVHVVRVFEGRSLIEGLPPVGDGHPQRPRPEGAGGVDESSLVLRELVGMHAMGVGQQPHG